MAGDFTTDDMADIFAHHEKSVQPSLALIDKAVERFQPSHIFGLFSGGHDSLTATSIAAMHPRFSAAVHINTGIGIEETRVFVRETCRERGWPLLEYKAAECVHADGSPDPQVYADLVRQHGFPGPPMHSRMYERLKERQLQQLTREHKRELWAVPPDGLPFRLRSKAKDKILLISGCRSEESERRMGHVEPIQERGVKVWVAVIHDWSKANVRAHLHRYGIRRNPVVDKIHKSGECLCGAFARPGELDELAKHFPEAAAKIRELEREVMLKFPWGWEGEPPKWWRQDVADKRAGQRKLFCEPDMTMCHNCERQRGMMLAEEAA